jgi:hypothetical protein
MATSVCMPCLDFFILETGESVSVNSIFYVTDGLKLILRPGELYHSLIRSVV